MIWSDKAHAYVHPIDWVPPNIAEFCWTGEDWTDDDLKENDEWMKETQRMLNQH